MPRVSSTLLAAAAWAAVFVFHIPCARAQEQRPLTVREVLRLNPTEGSYQVRGYVVSSYTCPICPSSSICEPCAPEHIVVADERRRLEDFPGRIAPFPTLRIPVGDAWRFEPLKQYLLTLSWSSGSSVGRGYAPAKVVQSRLLR